MSKKFTRLYVHKSAFETEEQFTECIKEIEQLKAIDSEINSLIAYESNSYYSGHIIFVGKNDIHALLILDKYGIKYDNENILPISFS